MKEAKKFLSMFLAAAITVTRIGFATPQNVNAASGKQYAVEEQEAVVTASDGDLLCLAQAVSASDGLAKVVSPGEGEEKGSVYGDTWTSVNTALQSAKLVQAKGTDVTKQEVKNVLMGLESALKGLKVVTADNGQLAVEVTADDGDEALLDAAVSAANAKKQADYTVESWEAFKTALDAAKVLAGLTIGTISVVKPEVIPTFLKSLFSLPAEVNREYIAAKREKLELEKGERQLPLDIEEQELNNLEKKLAILEKFKELGVDPKKVETSATALADTFGYLQIESAENNLPELPENDENVLDELLEEDIAEEVTSESQLLKLSPTQNRYSSYFGQPDPPDLT